MPHKKDNYYELKGIGFGNSAYLFDYIDDVLQEPISKRFNEIFNEAFNLKVKDTNDPN